MSADPHASSDDAAGNTATSSEGRSIYPPPAGLEHYPGSKAAMGVAERIIRIFPSHSLFIVPMLGGGAVLRRKRPALRTIGIDLDADVVKAWKGYDYPGLQLHHHDGIAWVMMSNAYGWIPRDALIYWDAPYLMRTRSGKRLYKFEMKIRDHIRMLMTIRDLPCSNVISGYDDPLYRDLLADFNHDSFPAMTRGGLRTEHIWWRSSLASFDVDRSTVGKDFRDRERIKRKSRRWTERYMKLPTLERQALLAGLLDAERNLAPSSEVTMLEPRQK